MKMMIRDRFMFNDISWLFEMPDWDRLLCVKQWKPYLLTCGTKTVHNFDENGTKMARTRYEHGTDTLRKNAMIVRK